MSEEYTLHRDRRVATLNPKSRHSWGGGAMGIPVLIANQDTGGVAGRVILVDSLHKVFGM